MAFWDNIAEGLVGRITARHQKAEPLPVVAPTSEVLPDLSNDHPEVGLPLGPSNLWRWYEQATRLVTSRKEMYAEYDLMDAELPEFSAALDIYAYNATRGDSDGAAQLTLKSDNPRAAEVLRETADRLNLDQILFTLARDVVKYGERAEEVIVDSKFNVARLKPLPTQYIIPKLDKYGRPMDPPYAQVNDEGKEIATFQGWQMLFIANKKSRSDLTGRGVGYAARRPFKQLRMMEDAIVVARLTRAHQRLAYMVDTGQLTPKEAQTFLDAVKAKLRKRRTINARTGTMDFSFNPLSIEEDIFVATNKESRADVKVLQGDLTVGNLTDLEYIQQKVFTAMQVPKTYLSHEKDTRTRAVVSQQDIQFARAVRRVQFLLQDGFKHVFDLALQLKGFDTARVGYTVGLPVISTVDELRQWQTEQLKILVAQQVKLTFWPDDEWILKTLLGYDDDEVAALLAGQKADKAELALLGAPKAGNAPNSKVAKEAAEVWARLHKLPAEQQELVMESVRDLAMLSDWALQS